MAMGQDCAWMGVGLEKPARLICGKQYAHQKRAQSCMKLQWADSRWANEISSWSLRYVQCALRRHSKQCCRTVHGIARLVHSAGRATTHSRRQTSQAQLAQEHRPAAGTNSKQVPKAQVMWSIPCARGSAGKVTCCILADARLAPRLAAGSTGDSGLQHTARDAPQRGTCAAWHAEAFKQRKPPAHSGISSSLWAGGEACKHPSCSCAEGRQSAPAHWRPGGSDPRSPATPSTMPPQVIGHVPARTWLAAFTG